MRKAALAAAAVAVPGIAVADGRAAGSGVVRPHPRWRFVFVNHATTNPFFVPTRYGIEDAGALFGVDHVWTGSRRSDVREMTAAMRRAIDARARRDRGLADRRDGVQLADDRARWRPASR